MVVKNKTKQKTSRKKGTRRKGEKWEEEQIAMAELSVPQNGHFTGLLEGKWASNTEGPAL